MYVCCWMVRWCRFLFSDVRLKLFRHWTDSWLLDSGHQYVVFLCMWVWVCSVVILLQWNKNGKKSSMKMHVIVVSRLPKPQHIWKKNSISIAYFFLFLAHCAMDYWRFDPSRFFFADDNRLADSHITILWSLINRTFYWLVGLFFFSYPIFIFSINLYWPGLRPNHLGLIIVHNKGRII